MLKQNVKKDLPTIQVPALIVWGGKDALIPVAVAEEAHRLIPGSKLVVIPECGHFPMIEKSEVFNQTIDDFLGGKDE
jgi:pimeloyl-ACP methyl ester carboxylesterase